MQGVAANAEALSNLVRGHNGVNNLFSYMSFLGIQGMGLVEATERSPVVGHIIGTQITHLVLMFHPVLSDFGFPMPTDLVPCICKLIFMSMWLGDQW